MGNMEQQSTKWHEWRKQGLGSSDAPVIMGVSPYRTRLELWEEKTGRVNDNEMANFVMQRGVDLEPKARAWYELHNDRDMEPMLFVHGAFPYLKASLDGCCQKDGLVLEIKYQGVQAHLAALKGVITEHYKWQLDHQLACTGFEEADFLSYNEEAAAANGVSPGAVVRYKRDLDREAKLLEEEHKFWKLVQSDTPPESVKADFKLLRFKDVVSLFEAYKIAELEKDEAAKEQAIAAIVQRIPKHRRVICNGMLFTRTNQPGGPLVVSIQPHGDSK